MNGDRTVGLAISHASSEAQPVFRFWSPVYQKHFYTISESERDLVITNDPNWDYEGVVFDGYSDQVVDSKPLYRFWSPVFEGHFYTSNELERQSLIDHDANWDYEGIAYFIPSSGTAVYRFYSEVFEGHFYTLSVSEKDDLIAHNPDWRFEGVAFYSVDGENISENPMCGNAVLESGEQCDDGNVNDGDGCSALCDVEIDFCGNAEIDSGEQCDDGNLASGDGCSSLCEQEFEEIKWGFWGEDRNAYSGGPYTPAPDNNVETFYEPYTFAHNKASSLHRVAGDTNDRRYLVNILNAARATNTTLDLQLGGSDEYGWDFSTSTGDFSIDQWKDAISRFGAIDRIAFDGGGVIAGDPAAHAAIVEALNDGVIKYVFLLDEPNHPRWSPSGSDNNHVTNAMLDEMAQWVKVVFGDADQGGSMNGASVPIQTIVRTSAFNLAFDRGGLYEFQHMTHSYLTLSSPKWLPGNSGPNRGLEFWLTVKDNLMPGITQMNAYGAQGLKMSLMVQAGFESEGNPWTGAKDFALDWWDGDIKHTPGAINPYVKTAPWEMDYWIKSLLSPRHASTGQLDSDGVRWIDEFVIFRADRSSDAPYYPFSTYPHYRLFLDELGIDLNANQLIPRSGIPVGWDGSS